MMKSLKILCTALLVLLGACGAGNETSAASRGKSVNLSIPGANYSAVKYFQDGTRFGQMKKQDDGNFEASLPVKKGTHVVKFFADGKNVSFDVPATADGFRICQRTDDGLSYSWPITADQTCPDVLVEKVKVGNHLASQETSLPQFADADSFSALIKYHVGFVIVDMECFAPGREDCVSKVRELKSNGTLILVYGNPQECMLGDVVNDRPWQQERCDWVRANAPEWLMSDTDGNPLVLWHAPDMQTLNMSRTCPLHGGITWTQYYVNFMLVKLDPYADLIDGVLFDNAKAFISYEPFKLYDPATGNELTPFEVDDSWRGGYRDMLKYFHDQLANYPQFKAGGREFLTAVVSKQSDFSDLADVVIFESPFNSSVGALTDDYHPYAVVDQYLRMAAKTRLMIIEHCVKSNGECKKWFYPSDNGRETGYALDLLADNSLYVFDQDGPISHGGFTFDPIYQISGKATGPAQYPYALVESSPAKQTLTNNQSIAIHNVKTGDVIRYSYRVNGAYKSNSLHNSDETAEELAMDTRWVDGTVNGFAEHDGDYVITFTGNGSADVWDVVHYDPSRSSNDFLFCREYEHVKACFNPSATETRSMTFGSQTVAVPAMQGKVLSK